MTVLDPVIHALLTSKKKVVDLQTVIACADCPRKPVLRVLDKLVREGYLIEIEDRPVRPRLGECGPHRRNPTWRIVRDLTDRPGPAPRKNTERDKLWRLIRAKRHFTKIDLIIASGASSASVDNYVRKLEYAGHVRRTGKDGRRVTYMLVNRQVARPVGLDGGKK